MSELKVAGILREELRDIFNQVVPPDDPESTKSVYDALHKVGPKALCLSGGGIRSATFSLGVLQVLAEKELLEKFDYLSTVSGGGYIGSWLSAWVKREPGGIGRVSEIIAASAHAPDAEPQTPVQRLRDFTSYLSPRLGILSADTWTLLAIYIRNLLLNGTVLIPLIMAALMVPRVALACVRCQQSGGFTAALLVVGAVAHVVAVAYMDRHRPELQAVSQNNDKHVRFLWGCLIWLMLSGTLLTWAWVGLRQHAEVSATIMRGGTQPCGLPANLLPCFSREAVGSGFTLLIFMLFKVALSVIGWIVGVLSRPPKEVSSKTWFGLFASIISASFGGWVLWVFAKQPLFDPTEDGAHGVLYACAAMPVYFLAFLLAGAVLRGLFSLSSDDADREWSARAAAWVMILITVWPVVAVLVLYGPDWLDALGVVGKSVVLSTGGLAGLLTAVLSRSEKTPANAQQAQKMGNSGIAQRWVLALATPVFIVFLMIALSLVTDFVMTRLWSPGGSGGLGGQPVPNARAGSISTLHDPVLLNCPLWLLLVWQLSLSLVGAGMSGFVDVNKFSLQSMYRNRLIRAYLGASRQDRERGPTFNAFTGFDPKDDLAVSELCLRPFHVINIALNLVHGRRLAWQERRAESFTVTPLHSGSAEVGYRCSQKYGGGIQLGTALATSGAAANPNMGYHSSPALSFLMTLLNVRMGVWLGNPSDHGNRTFDRSSPRFSILPLIQEAFGLTDNTASYVNLSDGGHFENLGIYEMVRRRCHWIVAIDAGQDAEAEFEDLGNAVRKIQIDLGIRIDFTPNVAIYPREPKPQPAGGKYFAIGRIVYSATDSNGGTAPDGYILYIKPALYGNEPIDVFNYSKQSKTFPHETTMNQFFTESQFESYRSLGMHIMRDILRQTGEKPSFQEAFQAAAKALRTPPGKQCCPL